MLLSDLLDRAADRRPDKDCAVFGKERWTFAALERASNQVARRLRGLGIGPGRRVALLQESSAEALIWFWGVLKSGAQSVDIPTLIGTRAIETILDEAKPDALCLHPRAAERLKDW